MNVLTAPVDLTPNAPKYKCVHCKKAWAKTVIYVQHETTKEVMVALYLCKADSQRVVRGINEALAFKQPRHASK